MKAVQDFNYKVALASGLKHLQGGKLRQAEEQFRYLVSKFPQADGGYRGLARVQVEVGDRPAAVATLRDGAAALSRSGERGLAIDLLGEATSLDPLDLSAHRRLAAALALAGDVGASAAEYVRFANAEIAAGDPDRAKLEANYALETLGEIPALHDLARTVGLQLRTVRRLAPEPVPVPEPFVMPEREPVAPEPAWTAPVVEQPAWTAAEAPAAHEVAPPPAPTTPTLDAFELEELAATMIASGDPDAGRVAIEAASALTARGKVQAASDLLLQLVARGVAVHDAERELIGVARALGRNDIAEERERLLDRAMRVG
ncbi:MAG TPA: hypothetical protein VGA16_00055 [Candidatus Limnocylindria bacterium]